MVETALNNCEFYFAYERFSLYMKSLNFVSFDVSSQILGLYVGGVCLKETGDGNLDMVGFVSGFFFWQNIVCLLS